MDGVLKYLIGRRDHLTKVIPLYESRTLGTHDGPRDTTEETLAECNAHLHEVEALIAKHERGNA